MMQDLKKKIDDITSYIELNRLDLSKLNLMTNNGNMVYDIHQPPGVEHYRLLCQLSMWFNNTTIYELGTWIGAGTICMAYNKTNRVVSYDIDYRVDLMRLPNMEFRLGDYKKDPELLKSPFIFVDVSHDGTLEREIYKYLCDNNYKGLTVWDDINLNPEMRSFWADVKHDKRDISRYGHYSGTGVIFFE
jgi:hypothetical protein